MRILIVEDDLVLSRQLAETLSRTGDAVDCAGEGEEGHFLGDTEPYDAVVLDLGLPRLDGITVLKRWRAAGRTMPVLILTARGSWTEKVQGIDAGAGRLSRQAVPDGRAPRAAPRPDPPRSRACHHRADV